LTRLERFTREKHFCLLSFFISENEKHSAKVSMLLNNVTLSLNKEQNKLECLSLAKHSSLAQCLCVRLLRFVYTCNLDLALSLINAISIEILPSFQIATAGDSNNV
jgi:hypothetical protein